MVRGERPLNLLSALRARDGFRDAFILVTAAAALLLNAAGLLSGITIVIPHLLYVPVVIAAYRYPRRGGIIAGGIGAIYFLMVIVVNGSSVDLVVEALVRTVVLIAIGWLVGRLTLSLREQEDLYQGLFDHSESGSIVVDAAEKFKELVRKSLVRQVSAINRHTSLGTYFFDYGNAFLLESSRAGADILKPDGEFRYPSYVQDIMGPLCFDYGFGPFRWVCCSNDPADLALTDSIAVKVLKRLIKSAPDRIRQQLADNIHWIKEAEKNRLVVGSQARILYADADGRIAIADAFNRAIKRGLIKAPVVIGRDHHDVSGTDSPFRETSNVYDGSKFTADMSIQNVIGDSFRGATWVSIHNGGGVGWGEVINGGFGMLLDGTRDTGKKLKMMLHWDVIYGIARRSWARNDGAIFTLRREMEKTPGLQVTVPYIADDQLIENLF